MRCRGNWSVGLAWNNTYHFINIFHIFSIISPAERRVFFCYDGCTHEVAKLEWEDFYCEKNDETGIMYDALRSDACSGAGCMGWSSRNDAACDGGREECAGQWKL